MTFDPKSVKTAYAQWVSGSTDQVWLKSDKASGRSSPVTERRKKKEERTVRKQNQPACCRLVKWPKCVILYIKLKLSSRETQN
jgi:hypothetical protein